MKSNIQIKDSNYVAFSQFHGCAVNNLGISLSFGNISKTIEGTSANEYISDNIVSENDFVKDYMFLYNYANGKGFDVGETFLFSALCVGKMKNSFVVSPDGNIYKCLSTVGRLSESKGHWSEEGAFSKQNETSWGDDGWYFSLPFFN